MWLAPVIFLGIALCIAGLVFGVAAIIVPGVLLLGVGLAFHFGVMRQSGDKTGKADNGPAQTRASQDKPEDTDGGPTHAVRGPAHEGQRNMTP